MTRTMHFSTGLLALCALALGTVWSSSAEAVPSFARQTGMSCNSCHVLHGAPTPDFTFSGKKFNAFGYRTPRIHPAWEKGEAGQENTGERMNMEWLYQRWSMRFQQTFIQGGKDPATGDWDENETRVTRRLAMFYPGPIGDNMGMWNEFYFMPAGSETFQGGTMVTWEEMDFRYVLSETSDTNYSLALSNQDLSSAFGFAPFGPPDSTALRGGIGGYSIPQQGNAMLTAWVNDRFVYSIGANTGDTNWGWDKHNWIGLFGYAFENTNARDLWAVVNFRTGDDALPLVTRRFLTDDGDLCGTTTDIACFGGVRSSHFSESLTGVTATRPAGSGPYLPEDLDNHTTVGFQLRWGGSNSDFGQGVGPWSWKLAGGYSYNTEEYTDGAEYRYDELGVTGILAWKHSYYIKPEIEYAVEHEFTDHQGNTFEVDEEVSIGSSFIWKPVENMLIAFDISNDFDTSLTGDAETGGISYSVYTDIMF